MFMQALNRIFPLFRGLYQDKVANVWCAVNIVVKLRESFEVDELVVLRYGFEVPDCISRSSPKGKRMKETLTDHESILFPPGRNEPLAPRQPW